MKLYKFNRLFYIGIVIFGLASILTAVIPLSIRTIIDGNIETRTLVSVLVLFLAQAVLQALGHYILAQYAEGEVEVLRQKCAEKIMRGRLEEVDQWQSGELASHVMNDSTILKQFLVDTFPSFLSGILTIIISIIFLILLDWQLTLILVGILLIPIAVTIPISQFTQKYSQQHHDLLSRQIDYFSELIRQLPTIKVNGMESAQQERLTQQFRDMKEVSLKNDRVDSVRQPFVLMLLFGAISAIFMYGGIRVNEGTLSVGTLISFLVYLFQLLNPFGSLSQFVTEKAKVKGVTSSIIRILQINGEDYVTGDKVKSDTITIEDLTFTQFQPFVLDEIRMEIPRCGQVAIVGPSGSGKSTLIKLILRLYPFQSGMIRMGKQDIQTANLVEWRQQFALVSQSETLLTGTVRDNLVLGETEIEEDFLYECLEKVGLLEMVTQSSDKLDMFIGESGKFLSGGQRQRLQIARALVKRTPFIIFDEATSNLDADSQNKITSVAQELAKEHAVIWIAHRLSTIVSSDKIYFVEEGKITGSGTHEVLYAQHAVYRRYIDGQEIRK